MKIEDYKPGAILSVKTFNKLAEDQWRRNWDKAKAEGRDWGQMPQLAMYLYFNTKGGVRNTGYVKITQNGSMCFKTKELAAAHVEKVYS